MRWLLAEYRATGHGDFLARLLTSAAIIGVGAISGASQAQPVPPPAYAPTQGQFVAPPSAQSVAAANDNNNAQAATRPGAFANSTPGTIVVHINGRAHAGFSSI